MTSFHESIRGIVGEVEKCFLETMKKEELGKASKEHRQKILDMIQKFRDDYPQMGGPKTDSEHDKNLDKLKSERDDSSSITGGSSNTDEDSYAYSDTVPDVAAMDLNANASKTGFLEKKQQKSLMGLGRLQKRWCAIHNNTLYYYEKEKDKKQKGAIKLPGYKFQNAPDMLKDSSKKDLCFELVMEGKIGRTFQFVAPSKDEFSEWKTAIEYATGDINAGGDDGDGEDLYEAIDGPQPPPTQDDIYEDTANLDFEDDAKSNSINVSDGGLIQDEEYDDVQGIQPSPSPTIPPLPASRGPKLPDQPVPSLPPDIPGRPEHPPPLPSSAPPKLPGRGKTLPEIPKDDISSPAETTSPKSPVKERHVIKPEEDFENMYYSMWDCTADCDNELSFKRGEIIHIINKDFDTKQWWVGELQDKTGLVPKMYLTPAYELVLD